MKKCTLLLIIIFSFLSACSTKPTKGSPPSASAPATRHAPPVYTPSQEAKQLASEQDTNLVTEFDFKKGSEELTPASKQQLRDLSKKAMAKGKIELIRVITWADEEYPTASQRKLSREQLDLAKNRNEEIKKFLNEISGEKIEGDIQLISMAQRPGFFKDLLSSDDAKIKKSLETAGIPTTEGGTRKGAKSSRSIVLIHLEDKKK
ncbi:MAG: hypothetical protein WC635_17130 [Bacteriovorax sp.]|jgi:hypothetical protein